MPGHWSETQIPTRPGPYLNFETAGTTGTPGGVFGTVAIPIVADWGPIDEVQTLTSGSEADATFSYDDGTGTSTAHLIREVFKGGASVVKALRIADGTEAYAAKVLTNTTPATAITLTAKYKGTRGNNFTVTVRTNPLDAALRDLIIYEDGFQREIFTYATTNITSLGAQINASGTGSNLVTAVVAISGVALTVVTASAFTGGDSGSSPVTADYTDAIDAFEREGGFDVFTLDGVDSTAVITALNAWAQAQNDAGTSVEVVVGGALSESVSSGVSRAQGYDNEWVVSHYGDTYLTLDSGDEDLRSSAMWTPRIAGMIAGAGVTGSITRGLVPGARISAPLTNTEVETLINGGSLCFTKRSDGVIIEDGITSFTSYTDVKDATYNNLSSVRAVQKINTDLSLLTETGFLGKTRNTVATRDALIKTVLNYLETLEASQVLLPGTTVELDTRFVNTGYNIYLLVRGQFAAELKRILITVRTPTIS